MKKAIIIEGTAEELEKQLDQYIEEGYTLIQNMVYCGEREDGKHFAFAMFKKPNNRIV